MKRKDWQEIATDYTGIIEICDGTKYIFKYSSELCMEYWKNGQLHRTDGPAIIYFNIQMREFWEEGMYLGGWEEFDQL